MTEQNQPDTPPNATDGLSSEDKGLYDAIDAAFTDDPSSIPEKFQKAENPVLEYMKSYKGLERKLHEKPAEAIQEAPTGQPEALPETVDFDLPPEPGAKSFNWALQETSRNGGKLTNEVRAYLTETHKMDKEAIAYFESSVGREVQQTIASAAEIVGGVENLKALNAWVLKNKSRETIQKLNHALHDKTTMATTLKGLLMESEIQTAAAPKIQTTPIPGGSTASSYSTQAELTADLCNPILKDRWHPDHQAASAKIQARIKATPPGVLM